MALTTFIHDGESIDYTPSADVAVGDVVVQGELVGVARRPIAANTLGAVAVAGVFDVPKATGTDKGITVGSKVYWDATDKVATTADASGTNKLLGKTIKAAADAEATVRVRLSQ